MSFFKNLFGGKKKKKAVPTAPAAKTPPTPPSAPAPPAPAPQSAQGSDPNRVPDPGLGAEIVTRAQPLVRNRNWAALRTLYMESKGDARTVLLEGVCKHPDNGDNLEAWAQGAPDDAVAQLFCGANSAWQAWEARGGRLSKDVGMDKWVLFGLLLKQAATRLEKAISLDPSDAEPYHRMIGVLLGDSDLSQKSYEDYFNEVCKRRPDHLLAHMDALTHKCEKWGGTHAQMFDFARTISQNAPEGSLLHTLVPQSIMERSVYYFIEDDYDGANTYMKSDNTKSELEAAFQKSVGSSSFEQTPLTPVALNWFSCSLIYCSIKTGNVRGETIGKVGNKITDRPWAYIDVPVYGHVNRLRKDFGLGPV